ADRRPVVRNYTVRRIDHARRRIDIDRSAPPAVHEAQVRPGGGGRSTRRSCGGSPRHRCACPCRTPESP
ncbi:siderophore-interacting protein, partial [Streptomyces sp. NPDC047802]|uniref:siderophore-interacting protein n=1 Tax=Streptomyces sp. NPDC047802 TaxID=3157204 RepID=UPI00340D5B7D